MPVRTLRSAKAFKRHRAAAAGLLSKEAARRKPHTFSLTKPQAITLPEFKSNTKQRTESCLFTLTLSFVGRDQVSLHRVRQLDPVVDRATARELFRKALLAGNLEFSVADVQHELRGKNLACWCPLDEPCHADVLLELANKRPTARKGRSGKRRRASARASGDAYEALPPLRAFRAAFPDMLDIRSLSDQHLVNERQCEQATHVNAR